MAGSRVASTSGAGHPHDTAAMGRAHVQQLQPGVPVQRRRPARSLIFIRLTDGY